MFHGNGPKSRRKSTSLRTSATRTFREHLAPAESRRPDAVACRRRGVARGRLESAKICPWFSAQPVAKCFWANNYLEQAIEMPAAKKTAGDACHALSGAAAGAQLVQRVWLSRPAHHHFNACASGANAIGHAWEMLRQRTRGKSFGRRLRHLVPADVCRI